MKITMLEITEQFLEKNKEQTFAQIWKEVWASKKTDWKKQSPKTLLKDIENSKKAELYTLLTISGKFVKVNTNKFSLIKDFTFEEVKKMKVTIGEQVD